MSKPSIYNLGTEPRFVLRTTDIDGNPILPTEARISIEQPDGTIFTVSGGVMTEIGNTLLYQYDADQVGWYIYEGWVKDEDGREAAKSKGFYITNLVSN